MAGILPEVVPGGTKDFEPLTACLQSIFTRELGVAWHG
jgi:hypothetical protein